VQLLLILFFVLFSLNASFAVAPVISEDGLLLQEQDLLSETIDKEQVISNANSILPSELTLEIIADEIRYNQEKNYYEAYGKAEAFIPTQNAKLYADTISYDSDRQLIEAFGDIKVVQGENVIYGQYISFETDTKSYKMDQSRLFVYGLKLKSRIVESTYKVKKNGDNETFLTFKDGVAAVDEPISIFAPGNRMGSRYSRNIAIYNRQRKVDWDDLSDKSSLRYSAKEINIDNTRKKNNLSIKGARIWLSDHLSIPSPVHITTTVGEGSDSRFQGPVIGVRERIGGFALGPRFFHERDFGVFSLVPLLQIGDGPKFGAGVIGSFNTPHDKTAIMAGYGSLHDRFIGRFHQDIYKNIINYDTLVNQFVEDSIFGSSQVGQLHQLSIVQNVKLPFIDDRGMRLNLSGGWAKDNTDLFSGTEERNLRKGFDGDQNIREEHSGFRSTLESSLYTKPIWRTGNELYNVSLRGRGQGAARFYDTGDLQTIGRFGPALEARIDNLSFEIDYLFAAIGGESPFIFDQFIDGSQSVIFDGDYRVNKWFSVGTLLTYNINRDSFVRNEMRAEIGSQDFKIRLAYDTIRNQVNFGFNVLFGEPTSFDTLRVKL
jgi:lipopolysaccharide export system protein LptA